MNAKVTAGTQALARSLKVLSELLDSDGPVSATELASRVGLHQSSVSRILSTLQAVGFVRKPDYHHFSADYGLLTFAARALDQFPLLQRTLPVLEWMGPQCEPLSVTLATLWRQEVLYLVRGSTEGRMNVMPLMRWPLHLSSPGLRILLDLPEDEALAALAHSREELGWERPTETVPATEKESLRSARETLELDVLALVGWQNETHLSAAIPIRQNEKTVAALALSGSLDDMNIDRVRSLLHQGAREIEASLRHEKARVA